MVALSIFQGVRIPLLFLSPVGVPNDFDLYHSANACLYRLLDGEEHHWQETR